MGKTRVTAEVLERILEVTRQLAAPFDLTSMLTEVIDAGRSVLHAERGTVFLYDAAENELVASVATGLDPIRIPADRGIAGQTAQGREVINVPDCYADPRFNRDADAQSGYRTRCMLSLPLIGHDGALVGVLQLLNKHEGTFTTEDERIATTLAAQCAVALQRVRMTDQLMVKERLDRELAVAREIQMGILPETMPVVAGYDFAGLTRPAEETGGDTYDLVPIDADRVLVLLGDATGHGVGPAISSTQVRSMLRMAIRLGAGLDDAHRHLNDQLVADLADNRFVTAFIGVLDRTSHDVTYHAAGQGPLLHYRAAGGACEWHGSTTLPLGLMPYLPGKGSQRIRLEPGDILALITDGVFEYENVAQEQFGEDRVAQVVREHAERPMAELAERMLAHVEGFAAGAIQADDITMVLIRRLTDAG